MFLAVCTVTSKTAFLQVGAPSEAMLVGVRVAAPSYIIMCQVGGTRSARVRFREKGFLFISYLIHKFLMQLSI